MPKRKIENRKTKTNAKMRKIKRNKKYKNAKLFCTSNDNTK